MSELKVTENSSSEPIGESISSSGGDKHSDVRSLDVASLKSTDALIDIDKDDLNNIQMTELNGDAGDRTENSESNGDVDIGNKLSEEQLQNPDLTSLMDACQKGNLPIVQDLISSRTVSANDTFEDKVTALHWAAINDNLAIVKYLCENEYSKADPNIQGGDLKATPLHWACRNGLTYIVEYLLSNTSADPTLRDAQSYNALHLAVHSSNIMLVIYVVLNCCANASGTSKQIYIDEVDDNNRTSLHWAAYQGDIFTLNTLIKFGADVGKVDNTLFIPLHWAFMRGSKPVLKALVEAKSDIFAKNDKGKDSFEIAKDMNCYETWVTVLKDCGIYESNGWVYKPYSRFIDEKAAKIITFFLPYLMLPSVLAICSFSSGYAIPKLALSIGILFVSFWFLNNFILPIYVRESKAIAKSPFLAGIFSATAFWAILVWVYNILPVLWLKSFFTNVTLGCAIFLFIRTFFKTMLINPGYVPTPSDNSVILQQIQDLTAIGKFDSNNFCVEAHVRKPLRSRYSRSSNKLVARFDHYCPWVYNEIGVRNHKLFMAFVYSLNFGLILYIHITLKFFDKYKGGVDGYDSDDENEKCSLLSDDLCVGYKHNNFHFNLLIWCIFQLIWVVFLELTQTFQILKGITTWEFSLLTEKPSHSGPVHSHNSDGFKTCMKLIGLDQFVKTVKIFFQSFFKSSNDANASSSHNYNPLDEFEVPSDYGWRKNWCDFWFLGEYNWRNLFYLPIEGENNLNGEVVDYYKLYEYPAKDASRIV
ncbi:palmitoyltransferase Akr1p [[Candida] railenensis]|uniref:Palmitoyltransferase n=1 Tax=[Candida] railenensis TaxID=45579 RepID=A0A9P0QSQ5_9ASCO|nr:palmitoyltransferase Akr1p [[Candida] railenensis]